MPRPAALIVVRGDGLPRRSYLYTGDLPEWCWALLVLLARSRAAYNVGSPDPVTVKELACRTAELVPHSRWRFGSRRAVRSDPALVRPFDQARPS